MIGKTANNEQIRVPAPTYARKAPVHKPAPKVAPRPEPIVIGYAANDAEIRRPSSVVPISRSAQPAAKPRRTGIVIGRTARMLNL